MTDHHREMRDQILRSNLALRDWAAGLRLRSVSAREVARARRADPPADLTLADAAVVGPSGVSHLGPMPALGQVEVSDLFMILVDQHGFEVMDAVRALATGLAVAGYPLDHDTVS